jgi:hypothetical protein
MPIPVFISDGEDQVEMVNGSLSVAIDPQLDGGTIDAFGRTRVSQPTALFDSKLVGDNRPLAWDEAETSGSGTDTVYTLNQSSVTMNVTANTAGTRLRQTFRRFNYQPAKSQLILMTFVMGNTGNDITKCVGYYDDNNGLFLQSKNGVTSVVERSITTNSVVDQTINQADWNIDKLDGTGASGLTLDLTKAQIIQIDFEWLGVGRVRWGFVIDGNIIYVHAENHANKLATVYMRSPNLPLRYEIVNGGSGEASELTCICSSVSTEGGRDQLGIPRAVSTGVLRSLAGTVNTYAMLSMRLKAGREDSVIRLSDFQAFCATTDTILVSFILNATIAGTLPAFTSLANSPIEYATYNGTHLVSGGTTLYEYFGYGRTERTIPVADVPGLGTAIDGTRSIVTVCAKPVSTNPAVAGSIGWRELG